MADIAPDSHITVSARYHRRQRNANTYRFHHGINRTDAMHSAAQTGTSCSFTMLSGRPFAKIKRLTSGARKRNKIPTTFCHGSGELLNN
jgi:hypothetical protein